MTKPILTIGIPNSIHIENMSDIIEILKGELGIDYYIIVYTSTYKNMKFQVFTEKDHKDIMSKEFKAILNKSIRDKGGSK